MLASPLLASILALIIAAEVSLNLAYRFLCQRYQFEDQESSTTGGDDFTSSPEAPTFTAGHEEAPFEIEQEQLEVFMRPPNNKVETFKEMHTYWNVNNLIKLQFRTSFEKLD